MENVRIELNAFAEVAENECKVFAEKRERKVVSFFAQKLSEREKKKEKWCLFFLFGNPRVGFP